MNKVLFITVRADMGGGPKHVYDLCSYLSDVEIHIACPNEAPFYDKYKTLTKDVIAIPHRKFSIIKFFKLIQYCKDNGINVVHSHGRGAGIYSRLMGLWGLKIVHTFHGAHHTSTVERVLKNLVCKYIAVSESEKRNAITLGLCERRSVIVIQNGIDTEKFKNISSPNNKILGTISRLDPHKNNIELINFMKELPDYKLLIAGDGEEMEFLKSQAGSNVEFLGFVSDVPSFLSKIDIYVSASLGEGLPYSVLEAIAARKKIVISKVQGHMDILKSENLYNLGSMSEFVLKIKNAKYTTTKVQSVEECALNIFTLIKTL